MRNEVDLIHLIYVSNAIDDFSEQDLNEILSSSLRNNLKLGITGILVFNNGKFMQFLEGAEFNVMKTFAAIKNDFRHHGIDIVRKEKLSMRQFEDWQMRFTDPNDILENSGIIYNKLFPAKEMSKEVFDYATESHAWLLAFKEAV